MTTELENAIAVLMNATHTELAEAFALLPNESKRALERILTPSTLGCTCGYGGYHEPMNVRCDLNG